MPGLDTWNWQLDGWIIVAGVLCAAAAALLGNFLVLRRMSMLGDAISHAILPGLAAAFLISQSRTSWIMFVGAALVGVLTALLTEWIHRHGRVDEGASMGVVFTALFAIGVIMIVRAVDHVDLDPNCVLYGAIETTPLDRVWGDRVPRVVAVLGVVFAVNLAFVVLFYKELKISSFDPALATAQGINARLMHLLLMTLVAITAVASFEAVGNILVVAMLVVPAATAHLLTDRLGWMIALSVLIGAVGAVLGHLGAIVVPAAFGYGSTVSAGMMAVAVGVLFLLAWLFSPRHGLLSRLFRRLQLSAQIAAEDLLGLLYRREEQGAGPLSSVELRDNLPFGAGRLWSMLPAMRARGWIVRDPRGYRLTDAGRERAAAVLRSHRLWEQYLVDRADMPPQKTHPAAERLEHFTDAELRRRLGAETDAPDSDPHGKPIPPEKT